MSDKIQTIDLREQYYRVSNRIFDVGLNIYEIGVYSTICRFVNNDTKMAYPSMQKIADMLQISRRQVVRSLNGLVQKNLIYKKGSSQEGIANQYFLLTIHENLKTLTCDSQSPVPHSHRGCDSQSQGGVTVSHPIKTNKKKTNLKKLSIPDSLNTKEFIQTWEDWKQHRIEKKKPLTATSIKKQFKFLEKYGVKIAIEIIERSILHGWQGLFELSKNENQPPPKKKYGYLDAEGIKQWEADMRAQGKKVYGND